MNLSAALCRLGFVWNGPNGFLSYVQNPSQSNPPVQTTGVYTVTATSVVGCTNTAQCRVTVTARRRYKMQSNSPVCYGPEPEPEWSRALREGLVTAGAGRVTITAQISTSIPTVGLNSAGIYSLYVSAGPCQSTGTVQVSGKSASHTHHWRERPPVRAQNTVPDGRYPSKQHKQL